MKTFMVLCCALSVAHASVVALIPSVSHYHYQDGFGQHSYGYHGGPSAKHEVKTLDGITQGSYAYIDANNVLQTASYVSDPVNGFRVAATNIPQAPAAIAESPEVAAAKVAHFRAHEEAKAKLHLRKRRSAVFAPIAYTAGYTPYTAFAAPIAYAYSPLITTQYQAQDSFGQYNYGYNDGLSAKAEARAFDGSTNGGYSYVDSNGLLQNVQYTADALGFRVAASNLPVAPAALPVNLPEAPADTPEVVAAREAHLKAVEEAKAMEKTQDETPEASEAPETPAAAASEVPADTPEVAAARTAHLKAFEEVKARHVREQ